MKKKEKEKLKNLVFIVNLKKEKENKIFQFICKLLQYCKKKTKTTKIILCKL